MLGHKAGTSFSNTVSITAALQGMACGTIGSIVSATCLSAPRGLLKHD